MEVFFARIVIPRSRSRSFESITRSSTTSLARKVPDCFRRQSTSVVLPWSTCAMMAMFRMGIMAPRDAGTPRPAGEAERAGRGSGCGLLLGQLPAEERGEVLAAPRDLESLLELGVGLPGEDEAGPGPDLEVCELARREPDAVGDELDVVDAPDL